MADDTHQHDHDHDHDHAHDPAHEHDHEHSHALPAPPVHAPDAPAPDDLDPANASLADAMRVSFGILKFIMLLLVIAFVFSGVFEVKEGQQVAVRIRLGQIDGEAGKQVLGPGWHFAFPQPIDHVLLVPIKNQSLAIDKAFWFEERPQEATLELSQKTKKPQLIPGTDGSLITGDRNIVHAKWTVYYQVLTADEHDVLDFVRNVSADSDPDKMLQAAEAMVRYASERGIVRLAAEAEADFLFTRGLTGELKAKVTEYTQQYLDDVKSGITITEFALSSFTPPLLVSDAFNAVTNNENERATLIDNARKERSKTLVGSAGAAYPAVLLAIDAFEAARLSADAERITRTEAVIDALLDGDKPARDVLAPLADEPGIDKADLRDARTDAIVGGEVRRLIDEAKGYRTAVIQDTQGEVARFVGNLGQYKQNPRIVLNTLWQDARQDILSSPDIETFYLPDNPGKTLYLELNRDPEIQRKKESERYRQPPK